MEIRIAEKEEERSAVFGLRFEVFVGEQNVPPEIEVDSEDSCATHVLATERGVAVGCGRIIFSESDAHIGRLAVKKEYRGRGIGFSVCKFIVDLCLRKGYKSIWLSSQLHAEGFYKKLGFEPEGDIFTEAGIQHIKMVYK